MARARGRAAARRDQIERLHQNEWGAFHWKPEKKLRPDWKGVALGKDRAAAEEQAKRLNRQVEAWLAAKAQALPPRPGPQRRGARLTVSQLANLWRYGADGQGSDHWRGLRERTRTMWTYFLAQIEAEFGDEPAAGLTRGRVKQWLDPLKRRAPGTAASYTKAARSLFSWAMETEHIPRADNPFGRQKIPGAKRRANVYSFEDVRHLVRVADGTVSPPATPRKPRHQAFRPRPSLGTALVIAFGCVQRISDVLALGFDHLHERPDGSTRLVFDQSKSMKVGQGFELVPGVRIDMRLPPIVAARLTAAPPPRTPRSRDRLVVSETTGEPYTDAGARAPWRAIIARAVACDPARWGHLKGMQLRDGRRSGFVHLRKMGLTVEQIVNLSGHTLEEGYKIVEHYMPRTSEEADAVSALMTGEL